MRNLWGSFLCVGGVSYSCCIFKQLLGCVFPFLYGWPPGSRGSCTCSLRPNEAAYGIQREAGKGLAKKEGVLRGLQGILRFCMGLLGCRFFLGLSWFFFGILMAFSSFSYSFFQLSCGFLRVSHSLRGFLKLCFRCSC